MIRGDKPNGYFTTTDGEGRKVEGETRQCTHCQFIWVYKPGSGTRRGICTQCSGLICARAECLAEQLQRRQVMHSDMSCVPFEVWNYYLEEQKDKATAEHGKLGEGFEFHPSGLIIPKH